MGSMIMFTGSGEPDEFWWPAPTIYSHTEGRAQAIICIRPIDWNEYQLPTADVPAQDIITKAKIGDFRIIVHVPDMNKDGNYYWPAQFLDAWLVNFTQEKDLRACPLELQVAGQHDQKYYLTVHPLVQGFQVGILKDIATRPPTILSRGFVKKHPGLFPPIVAYQQEAAGAPAFYHMWMDPLHPGNKRDYTDPYTPIMTKEEYENMCGSLNKGEDMIKFLESGAFQAYQKQYHEGWGFLNEFEHKRSVEDINNGKTAKGDFRMQVANLLLCANTGRHHFEDTCILQGPYQCNHC